MIRDIVNSNNLQLVEIKSMRQICNDCIPYYPNQCLFIKTIHPLKGIL